VSELTPELVKGIHNFVICTGVAMIICGAFLVMMGFFIVIRMPPNPFR